MEDAKMPFLPQYGQLNDVPLAKSTSTSASRPALYRRCFFIACALAFVPFSLWTINHVGKNGTGMTFARGGGAGSHGDPSSSSMSALELADAQSVQEFTLPHNYSGTFPAAKLNTTLGFEKIYVLNLAHRQDKRDELAILSYVTDIEVEFIDGVTGAELANQTIVEYDKSNPDNTAGVMGCYRSHVKALRKIVEDRVETALILEDDADWDVDFRLALQRLQDPLARLIGSMKRDNVRRGPTDKAPYGDSLDWDQLYLGACLENPWTNNLTTIESKKEYNLVNGNKVDFDHPPYIVYDDDSTPPLGNFGQNAKEFYAAYGLTIDPTDKVRKRVVQKSRDPICTPGYAVTRRGAARLLYELTRGFNSPVDLQMAWAAEDGRVESYMVFPPIISQWRIENGGYRNSDINRPNPVKKRGESRPDKGYSESLRNSMRANFRKQLRPKGTEHM